MEVPDLFFTTHLPGTHQAHYCGTGCDITGEYPTEIELVQALLREGIDIKDYTGVGRGAPGSKFHCITTWRRKGTFMEEGDGP